MRTFGPMPYGLREGFAAHRERAPFPPLQPTTTARAAIADVLRRGGVRVPRGDQ